MYRSTLWNARDPRHSNSYSGNRRQSRNYSGHQDLPYRRPRSQTGWDSGNQDRRAFQWGSHTLARYDSPLRPAVSDVPSAAVSSVSTLTGSHIGATNVVSLCAALPSFTSLDPIASVRLHRALRYLLVAAAQIVSTSPVPRPVTSLDLPIAIPALPALELGRIAPVALATLAVNDDDAVTPVKTEVGRVRVPPPIRPKSSIRRHRARRQLVQSFIDDMAECDDDPPDSSDVEMLEVSDSESVYSNSQHGEM